MPSLHFSGYNEDDTRLRHTLTTDSITALKRYCNIPNLGEPMIRFYNTIAAAVARYTKWPHGLRDMQDSLYFYEIILNNTGTLLVPEQVAQAIRCVLVRPASNADPERTFSVAHRLSRALINAETLDDLMTKYATRGPSLLTVKPEYLAYQWMHPQPSLGLHRGKPSSFEKDGSIMKEIKTALLNGDDEALTLLHVKRHMILHGLNHRSDTSEIMHRLLQNERAKLAMFSIGSARLSAQQQPN